MKRFHYRMISVLAICSMGGLILSFVPPHLVNAANKDDSSGQRVWFSGSDTHGGVSPVLYTVPPGFKFVLTDIIVTRGLSSTEGVLAANIYSTAANAPAVGVPFSVQFIIDADEPDASAILNLSSGATFHANESVTIATAHDGVPPGNSQLNYRVGGVIFEVSNNDTIDFGPCCSP